MFTGQKAIKFGRKLVVKAAPTLGLAGFFPIREGNIFGAETVQYDAVQKKEEMGLPINRGGGARRLVGDSFQQISDTPPYYNFARPINLFDLKGRAAGLNEYDPANTEHVRRLIELMTESYMDIQDLIDRQIEWQASEVFQKGKIEFTQFAGVKIPAPLADYDFQMSADLFPLAAPLWAAATGAQKRAQLQSLADKIREKGKVQPTDIIMGRTANDLFWNDAGTLALLDNRRTAIGEFVPQPLQGNGFAFQGSIIIGAISYRVWLYEGRFRNPATGNLDFYIDTDKVVMIADAAERDRMHAGVDIVKPTDADVMSLFPGGVSLDAIADRVPAVQIPWAFTDSKNNTTEIGIATSVLMIPSSRGGHGCLTTA